MNNLARQINIIILGEPGAGKATLAPSVCEKFNLVDFDMGAQLAKKRLIDKNLQAAQIKTADRGNLTPTKLVQEILKDFISKSGVKKGILFNGHPKMLGEAKLVVKLLKKWHPASRTIFVYLSIPQGESLKRVAKRKGYKIGAASSRRPDDNASALANRYKYYKTNIAEVKKFLSEQFGLIQISGLGTKSEVRKKVLSKLQLTANKL